MNIVLVGFDDESLLKVHEEVLDSGWTIEVQFESAEAVLECVSGLRDRRRLFVVLVKDHSDVGQIKLLSGRFAGFPIMAVTENMDPKTLLDLMRAGATQIVGLPLQQEDFKSALTQISVQYANPTASSQVVAVAGVHGGCGATLLAANLAYEVAHSFELDCILVDLSLRLGHVAVCLDAEPRFSFSDAAGPDEKPDIHLVRQVLHKVTDHFSLIAGPCYEIDREACSLEDAMRVVDLCRNLCDVAVLDVPCTYDSFYFGAFEAADKVVLVAEQTVSSVRALALVWEQLKRDRNPDTIFALFNQFDPKQPVFTADRLAKLLNVSKVHTVSTDPKLRDMADSGGPLRVRSPGSPIVTELAQFASSILGIDAPVQAQKRQGSSLLKKIGIG